MSTNTACSSCGYNFEVVGADGTCNSCKAAAANGAEVTTKAQTVATPVIAIPDLVPVADEPAEPAGPRNVDLRPLTRNEAIDRLRELGYSGPVSFTASTLRLVVDWVQAGRPADANLPAGVLRFR